MEDDYDLIDSTPAHNSGSKNLYSGSGLSLNSSYSEKVGPKTLDTRSRYLMEIDDDQEEKPRKKRVAQSFDL